MKQYPEDRTLQPAFGIGVTLLLWFGEMYVTTGRFGEMLDAQMATTYGFIASTSSVLLGHMLGANLKRATNNETRDQVAVPGLIAICLVLALVAGAVVILKTTPWGDPRYDSFHEAFTTGGIMLIVTGIALLFAFQATNSSAKTERLQGLLRKEYKKKRSSEEKLLSIRKTLSRLFKKMNGEKRAVQNVLDSSSLVQNRMDEFNDALERAISVASNHEERGKYPNHLRDNSFQEAIKHAENSNRSR